MDFEQNKKQNRFQVVDALGDDSQGLRGLQEVMGEKFKEINKARCEQEASQPSFAKASDEGRYQQLKQAVDEGSFDIKGALGQNFNREHKSGEAKATYAKNKTHESKLKFRMLWAKIHMEELQKNDQDHELVRDSLQHRHICTPRDPDRTPRLCCRSSRSPQARTDLCIQMHAYGRGMDKGVVDDERAGVLRGAGGNQGGVCTKVG